MSEAVRRLDALVARWAARSGVAATARLNPPASDAALEALELEIGREIPEELRSLWLWHDGQASGRIPDDYLLGGIWLVGIASSMRERRLHLEVGMTVDDVEFFNEQWVPFARSGNTTISLDTRSGLIRASDEYGVLGTLASFDLWVDLCERAFEADVWNPELDEAELDRRRAQFTRDEQDFI